MRIELGLTVGSPFFGTNGTPIYSLDYLVAMY